MRTLRVCAVGLGLLFAFVATATASASTLGLTSPPSGSSTYSCLQAPFPTLIQSAQDPTTPYFVPVGGGRITQWQTNVSGDTPGAPITFAVVRPSSGNYTVVGADSETIPNPLPTSGVATFTLTSPIAVEAGDTLALYSSSSAVACYFSGGATPLGDDILATDDPAPPPSAGQVLVPTPPCGGGCTLDVAATLVQSEDAAVTTSAPSSATAGYPALLSSTVSNNGLGAGTITLTDTVPAGLTINAAAAGQGACSASGQTVTCTITGLAPGQSAPVDIVVTPRAAGSYTNSVSVGVGSNTDPNTANNAASATLTVGASNSARKCVVPKLKGVSLSLAKQLLHPLGCKAGPVRHVHSKSVHKGFLIGTKPGPGTYAAGRKITLMVSSGPAKKHHK